MAKNCSAGLRTESLSQNRKATRDRLHGHHLVNPSGRQEREEKNPAGSRQGAPTWRCKTSARPTGGSVRRTARVSTKSPEQMSRKRALRRSGVGGRRVRALLLPDSSPWFPSQYPVVFLGPFRIFPDPWIPKFVQTGPRRAGEPPCRPRRETVYGKTCRSQGLPGPFLSFVIRG